MIDWKVVDDHTCRFGKWYYSSDAASFSGLREYQSVAGPHQRVHEYANQCVAAVRSGDTARAKTLFNQANDCSHEVIDHLDRLQREVSSRTRV